jgi:hypothetical protein
MMTSSPKVVESWRSVATTDASGGKREGTGSV